MEKIEFTKELSPDRDVFYKLRPCQNEVVEIFRKNVLEKGNNKFHIIAPPGSGKTVTGIKLILESKKKAVVFSPNAAIQAQWIDRFSDCTEILEFEGLDRVSFSDSIEDGTTYLSLTYQSITVKERGEDRLHENALRIIDRIAHGGYELLIFDECHHLTNFWGEVLQTLVSKIKNHLVIGLTATPPVEGTGNEIRKYLELVGEVDYEIPLPAVVKDNDLAPYQDLVYFTTPQEKEIEILMTGQKEYRILLEKLEKIENGFPNLSIFVEEILEKCRVGGKIIPMDEWMREKPDQLIACVKYLLFLKRPIPLSVYLVDEMYENFVIDDFVEIISLYIDEILKKEKQTDFINEINNTMMKIGYRYQGKNFVEVNTGASQCLTLSASKLGAMKDILKCEMDYMGRDLKVLILVDYEFGKKNSDGINSIDVMNSLTSDPETDELDPIMLTGKTVLVDDDLLPLFLSESEKFLIENRLQFTLESTPEEGYMRISGKGRDWNTRNYVRLITSMLEGGLTRCLIGTRSLLGEGWDCVSLNTLIDMTVVASYVSVNQIRGRSIRKDRHKPLKCANNWDIITIYSGVEYGLYDYRRLERKFSKFYGISDDGIVEKGLGHVHPMLSKGNISIISTNIEEINRNMFFRAGERMAAREKWKIGSVYRNENLECLELKAGMGEINIRNNSRINERIEFVKREIRRIEDKKNNSLKYWYLGIPLVLAMFYSVYKGFRKRDILALPFDDESFSEKLHKYCYLVLLSLKECGLIKTDYRAEQIKIFERENGFYRIILEGSSKADSKLFSDSVWEILGPVQNHKYIIEKQQYTVPVSELNYEQINGEEDIPSETISCHPVPHVFGRKRELADIFLKNWNKHISTGIIHYTRRGKGKELVREWFRKNIVNLHREKKKIWE